MNRFVVISDLHIPYQDEEAIKAFLRFIKKNPIDTIIMNGDILDMYDCSSFDKNPDRINSLQHEIDLATTFFNKLRRIAPKAEIVFIKGNHEYRLERYLMKHPELFSLDALKLPNLLRLREFNIGYEPKAYKLGSLKVTHGSIVRKFSGYTAHAELDKNDCSGISGHTHRGGAYFKQTPSRYLAWYEGFCLCDIHPEYIENPNWTQGFIYGYVHKDSFAVSLVPIVEGKIKSPFMEE